MISQHAKRIINNPDDTRYMQSLLQEKPEEFFSFPTKWQEWFLAHPEMLHSPDKTLSPEAIQKLLYDKIMTIIHENHEWSTHEMVPYITLLVLSGLQYKEVMKKIHLLSIK